MPLTNPLDVLFKDIKKQLHEESRRPKPAKPTPISTYANPDNWRLGLVVRLVHVTEGPLGAYQEYFHKLSPTARRLLPANPVAIPARDELVFGEHWLHPKFQAPLWEPDSEAEIAAIEARFAELIEELEDDDL